MRLDLKCTLFFLLTCFSCLLYGQSNSQYRIVGRVSDSKNQPLIGATVRLVNSETGVTTDHEGEFILRLKKTGTYQVEVAFFGFKKEIRTVMVKSGPVTVSVRLEELVSELDEVVVTAQSEARQLELSAKSVQVIETRELKLKSADLGEVLTQTEGVNVQRAGGLGSGIRFSLNGLSGDQIRFFYDDIPLQFTPYAFGIANIPVNMIDRIEVYKGVVPVHFGADALGGAVNLASAEVYEGLAGSASYQVGSFNTHRFTASTSYADKESGFFVVAGGFYDDTDNNYKIDVALPNEQGQLQQRTVRRFHDGYRAGGANIRLGVRDKNWAKLLSVEGYYGDYRNEVQNSQSPGLIDQPTLGIEQAVAGNPFGELVFNSFSTGINANYEITLNKRWDFDLKAGYNFNERVSIDTTRNRYNWLGEVIRIRSRSGEFGTANHLETVSESLFARQQINYQIAEKQVLKLSLAPTYAYRTGDELLIPGEVDPALDDQFLADLVTGVEYNAELLNERLQLIAFIKNYRQQIRIASFDQSLDEIVNSERIVSNYGAGNGLKYAWSPRFSTKFSYEFAYRLPRLDEVFGDGQLIFENRELRSENSHNVNIQWVYTNRKKASTDWQLSGNLFLRQIDDLIFLLVGANDFGAFQNVAGATSRGFEFSGSWDGLLKGLSLSSNVTFQRYVNTSEAGPFQRFSGDRIPNIPYLFANSAAQYELVDILKKRDKLSAFWNVRYVNSFFVSWESAGLQQFKAQVPNQIIHAAGFIYRMPVKNIQNALSIEVQNLTDAKVFDLFGVQRPGRAFYIKSTIQF